jgi:hypothetical protein
MFNRRERGERREKMNRWLSPETPSLLAGEGWGEGITLFSGWATVRNKKSSYKK